MAKYIEGDESMLDVKNLAFKVQENDRERYILDHVSFSVNSGETLIITGPNGSGKSTLAKVLMGLEPSTAGSIFLDGEDITNCSIDERARKGIGYAFQQPPRFKGMTVYRLIELSAGREMDEDECCGILAKVGLCAKEYLNREIDSTLSGGEMKRLEIATVLAKKHKVCIFDEPEAGIDLWSFSMLIKEFEELNKKRDRSIILISHQERIIRMADKIMVIEGGRISGFGTRDEILPTLLKNDAACKYMS